MWLGSAIKMKVWQKGKNMRKKQAFTLIELMVVVAIIAILATLAVSNFSVATKKTRNTQRVNDIKTVGEAMETCYDLMSGTYSVAAGNYTSTPTASSGIFSAASLACLNADVRPANANYTYTGKVVKVGNTTTFVACALLEPVSGYGAIGNSTKDAGNVANPTLANSKWTLTACNPTMTSGNCYFCVTGQQ